MIYKFLIRNNSGKLKEMLISEETENKFYHRVMTTYGVSREDIELLEEYKETNDKNDNGGCGYELYKSHVKDINSKERQLNEKSYQLFTNSNGLNDPYKTEYINKNNFSCDYIEKYEDIVPYLEKYKKVKVYWNTTDKRGEHKYYVLYK